MTQGNAICITEPSRPTFHVGGRPPVIVINQPIPSLPTTQQKSRVDAAAVRQNDLLKAQLTSALSKSGRYAVKRNVVVPLTSESRRLIRRLNGEYIGTSLSCGNPGTDDAVVDLVIIDEHNDWAGAYVFSWNGSHSARTRRKIERNLRSVELVLRSHLRQTHSPHIATVTVGIIDGGADSEGADDLTISLAEIADHFGIPF
jgi:hypothetical protein